MKSSSVTPSRLRRVTARIAVAGALAAVPVAALAIPASAATTDSGIPVVSQIADPDWNHDRGGDNQDRHDRPGDQDRHDRPGDQDRGPDQPQPQPEPQAQPQPPTGSFG
ncbi:MULTISPECIES: hypothetical protein [unclassified Nocardia]|uniref:hypothetical protein n=1 Tax=unclassified Nocardia TaxID=2637762 RepID=UPI0033A27C55